MQYLLHFQVAFSLLTTDKLKQCCSWLMQSQGHSIAWKWWIDQCIRDSIVSSFYLEIVKNLSLAMWRTCRQKFFLADKAPFSKNKNTKQNKNNKKT